MLKAFYNYLADMTLSFFSGVSLKKGDKYTLKLEDSNDVQSFYDSIKSELLEKNQYVECELPTKGENLIIIDNGDFSYQETIEFIVLHSSDFISYATYMPHSNVVMSPLMDFACLPTK